MAAVTMNPTLEDEILSINAIYGDNTLRAIEGAPGTCVLHIQSVDTSLRLYFSPEYPNFAPTVIQPESSASRKGEAHEVVKLAEERLDRVFLPGTPCIYDLLEDLNAALPENRHETNGLTRHEPDELQKEQPLLSGQNMNSSVEPQFTLSEVVSEKKSVFLARAAPISSPDDAHNFVHFLKQTDKKAAKATHNIIAWRLKGENDVTYHDCDDDGETAAGARLLHLLELMHVWGVLVIVTRWYGGIHLGPDRFRIINSVARDAIVKSGLAEKSTKSQKKKRKSK